MSNAFQLIDGKVQKVNAYAFDEGDKKTHIALVTVEDKTFEVGQFKPFAIEPEDDVIVVAKPNRFGLYSVYAMYNKTTHQYKESYSYIYFILGIVSIFMGGLFTLWAIQEVQTYGVKASIPEIILPLIFLPLGVGLLINVYHHLKARILLKSITG